VSWAGKKCGKRAKKSEINGIARIKTNLCWRHRKTLTEEYIADILSLES